MRSGTNTAVYPPPPSACAVPKKRFIASPWVPPSLTCLGSSGCSHAVMVSTRSPTMDETNPMKPFMPRSSVATWRLNSFTPFSSAASRARSAVMLKAPGRAVEPPEARVDTPKVNGPIAFGCTTTCRPSWSGIPRESK